MWQGVFGFTNVVALLAWAVLVLAPRKPLPLAYVLYGGVAMLCLAYAAMFVGLVTMLVDPVRDPGLAEPDLLNYSVVGLKDLFRSEGAIVLGWTHYLALDLFTGLWIARDADAKGFSRVFQAPFLVLTFMAGPLGLLVWLLVRERRARKSGWTRSGKTPAG
ncbi:hypothetical protein A6F68_02881 [Tsuneonella dongtanensis]|uniref:DUF4281 domain-containing protein n=1 Tax=Tsuneonella dongtanensis TaxID=692370 RepID=A0A1B2AGV4_9SPHN|nr:ABA4-like family protein [Tsuneonella dongtanensis]ANY21369.1 hypothetical protein A6F68_02881 [Tsuneonella dongtanensis]